MTAEDMAVEEPVLTEPAAAKAPIEGAETLRWTKEVTTEGTGDWMPEPGMEVDVHYIGTFHDDHPDSDIKAGDKFDSSRDRPGSFKFKIGQGQVIQGWDEGVMTMKKGERAKFVIPWEFAYGPSGSPPAIPANATLDFDIELFGFQFPPKEKWELSDDEKLEGASEEKEKGTAFFKDQKFYEAIASYEEATSFLVNTEHFDGEMAEKRVAVLRGCHLNLAMCYLKVEQFEDAVGAANNAIGIDVKNVKAWYRKGIAHMSLNEFPESKDALTEANRLDPKDAAVRSWFADWKKKKEAFKAKEKSNMANMFAKMGNMYTEKEDVVGPVEHKIADLPKAYFDVKFGKDSEETKRITFALFTDSVPKTADNFLKLCSGETGKCTTPGNEEKERCFKDSIFHRIIKGFMIQGGDFTNFNGTGGESIYGEKFNDEKFVDEHDKKYQLSMANAGPNTNGSQFFITTSTPAHLNGKHVVFGEVIEGFEVVDEIENAATGAQDKPDVDIIIADCGVL